MLPLGQAGGKDGSLGHPKTKRLAKRQKKIVKKENDTSYRKHPILRCSTDLLKNI